MARRPTLADLLGSPHTQNVVQQLAQGVDPRLVAARFAGDVLARQIADGMGIQLPLPAVERRTEASIDSKSDVIDVDYTIIDVTPRKKGK